MSFERKIFIDREGKENEIPRKNITPLLAHDSFQSSKMVAGNPCAIGERERERERERGGERRRERKRIKATDRLAVSALRRIY